MVLQNYDFDADILQKMSHTPKYPNSNYGNQLILPETSILESRKSVFYNIYYYIE